MSRAESLWERLVNAALLRDRTGAAGGGPGQGSIVNYVPSSLSNNRDIDAILRAADEIQDEDPNIARICKLFTSFLRFSFFFPLCKATVVIFLTIVLLQCVSMLTHLHRILILIAKAEVFYNLKLA